MARAVRIRDRKERFKTPAGARIDWDDRRFTAVIAKQVDRDLLVFIRELARQAKSKIPHGTVARGPRKRGGFGQDWYTRQPGRLWGVTRWYRSRFPGGGYVMSTGGRTAYYWFWVEYGTRYRGKQSGARQAFALPAYRRIKARIRSKYGR